MVEQVYSTGKSKSLEKRLTEEIFEWSFIVVAAILLYAFQWAFPEVLLQTNDSWHYLSAASSFAENDLLLDSANEPLHFWPPFFSIILSLFDTPQLSIWILHFFFGILNIFGLRYLAKKFIAHSIVKTLFLVVGTLSISHFLMIGFLLSEMLFATLLLWTIVNFLQYREEGKWISLSMFWLSALCLGLTRQSGLFIILALGVFAVVANHNEKYKYRNFIFYAWPAVGNIFWNISTTFFVENSTKWFDLTIDQWQSGITFLQKTGIFFLPMQSHSPFLGVLVALSILIGLFVLHFPVRKNSHQFLRALPYLIFIYIFGHIMLTNVSFSDADRFLAPISFILYFWVFYLADQYLSSVQNAVKRFLIPILLAIWISYPLYRSFKNLKQWHRVSNIQVERNSQP